MNNPVLECRELTKQYRDGVATINVLNSINLTIQPAELVSIIGNSGSGKSTLMHLLGGLDTPTSGDVFISGVNIANLKENKKCQLRNNYLGFVYQFHHLLPEFTAVENVCIPLLIRGISPKKSIPKAEFLLEEVGLKNRLNHRISELSGGERQRVAIARALVIDPICVLADEPTGNLDPDNADIVLQLFLKLQKNNQTSVIIVTHDKNIAEQTDRILMIDKGRLVPIATN